MASRDRRASFKGEEEEEGEKEIGGRRGGKGEVIRSKMRRRRRRLGVKRSKKRTLNFKIRKIRL